MNRLILFLLIAASMSLAQPGGNRGDQDHRQRGDSPPMMLEQLNLTDQQRDQIDKLRSEAEKNGIKLRSQIGEMRVDLRGMMRKEQPDQPAIEGTMAEISKLQNRMKLNRVGLWFGIHKILTPEQQKLWRERLPEGSPRPGHQRGPGMGMGMDHRGMRSDCGRHGDRCR